MRAVQSCRLGLAVGLVVLAAFAGASQTSAQDRAKITIVPNIPHSNRVTSVAFAPDGTRLLSGSRDRTLKLWEVATGRLLRTIEAHASRVTSVAFSPDGIYLLSSGDASADFGIDPTLRLWDTATGLLIRTFEGHTKGITSAAFSRNDNGARLISGSQDKTLKLWETATGKVLRTFEGHSSGVSSVALSPDGSQLLSGSNDKTVKLWDVATARALRTFEGHSDGVLSVAFSSDGTRLVSGGRDKTLRLWDTATGRLIRTFEGHSRDVNAVAFSADGSRLVSGSGGGDFSIVDVTLRLWDATTGKVLTTFQNHNDWISSVAISSDGTQVLSGGSGRGLKLWDVTSGELVRSFEGQTTEVYAVAFSPDGTRLVSEGGGTLRLWDVATGKMQSTLRGHTTAKNSSVVFSPDGRQILSGGSDNTVNLWDAATGQLLRTFKGHSKPVRSVAFSRAGGRLLSGGFDGTKLWDAASGKLIRTFEGHSSEVNSLAFSPDGMHFVSGSWDKTLKLWDAISGKLIRTFEGHSGLVTSVAFSPDGRHVLSGSFDRTMRLWDVSTGKQILTVDAHSGWINSVAFSPDGARILSANWDGTLKLWDAGAGKLLRTYHGHSGVVFSAAFSPDGLFLASGSGDGTVRLWNVANDQSLATFVGTHDGEWVAMTPAGFFIASNKDKEVLAIVRGVEPFSIMQFYDHLYRPDLVEQLLKGDPEGKYADAASKLNLQTILDSGPAPQIEKIPGRKTEHLGDTIKVTLRVVDTGGGIGEKVIWRVNGVTQGEVFAPSGPTRGDPRVITQTLKITPGKTNDITVTAYNGSGMLATEPYRIPIGKFGDEPGPRMHVLAVGVSDYARQDWRLKFAAADAKALGDLLKAAAKGLYDDIKVTSVLDGEATERGIAAAIERIKDDVQASDVFVLFVAGHGRNIAGTYYFLPQDLSFEGGRTVVKDAVGQDKLQAWLAKIPAQKSILILDTCESATATRSLDIERETAIERLRHATGRSVITAAGNAAFEGYEGHGLLTYAILDAFRKVDSSSDDEVDLYRLASHVDRMVPIISQRVFGQPQRPHNKIGGNFPLGARVAALTPPATDSAIPKTPTHVLIRAERVREKPVADAPGERELSPGADVRVVEFVGEWAIVARDGQKLGYVPAAALARRH